MLTRPSSFPYCTQAGTGADSRRDPKVPHVENQDTRLTRAGVRGIESPPWRRRRPERTRRGPGFPEPIRACVHGSARRVLPPPAMIALWPLALAALLLCAQPAAANVSFHSSNPGLLTENNLNGAQIRARRPVAASALRLSPPDSTRCRETRPARPSSPPTPARAASSRSGSRRGAAGVHEGLLTRRARVVSGHVPGRRRPREIF